MGTTTILPSSASDVNFSLLTIKPAVLLTIFLVISDVLVTPDSHLLVNAASSSSTSTAINNNRFYSSDAALRKNSDPYYEDFGKESGNVKRSHGRDDLDSEELERAGGASGQPLSTSAKANLIDYRDNTGCPPQFGGRCKCGEVYVGNLTSWFRASDPKMYTVNCTDAGFSSPDPLKSLPQNTEVLVFTGNLIQHLPVNIFGNKKAYPDLKFIDLSANGIETILGKTFHKVNACETLILDNNKISKLTLQDHARIFSNFLNLKNLHLSSAFETDSELLTDLYQVFNESNLKKLEKIHLEGNKIDYISEPRAFCELPSLMDIHLSQNKLADLNLDITCLEQARYVDLTFNNIRTVGENSGVWKLFHEKNRKGSQIQVNLWKNPFNCDCRLEPFIELLRNWTKSNSNIDLIQFDRELECADGLPKNNTNMLLRDVVHTECPVLVASDYGSTAVSATAWILGILFLAGIGYFLFINQNLLCRPANPLHQTTTQGVKYTTIQEEEAEVAHV